MIKMIKPAQPIDRIKKKMLYSLKEDQTAYDSSPIHAVLNMVISLYKFSDAWNFTNANISEYRERVLKLFTENTLDFSDSELKGILHYFDKIGVLPIEESEAYEKEIVKAITDWYAYRNQLLQDTEEFQRIVNDMSVRVKFPWADIQQYIEYWKVFKQENTPQTSLYYNLYKLGYVSGKQSKTRKKQS